MASTDKNTGCQGGVPLTSTPKRKGRKLLIILLCLILALRGPRFTDRIVALNVICTLVILLICILSFLLEASYLLDVAILYGLLNLLAIVLLSRLTVTRRKGRKEDRS